MSEWQPIKTAPKDGTKILIECHAEESRVLVVVEWFHGDWIASWDHARLVGFEVTHWMPLPAPPSTGTGSEEGL